MNPQTVPLELNELLVSYAFTLGSAIAGSALDRFSSPGGLCPRRVTADWLASGVVLIAEHANGSHLPIDELWERLAAVPHAGGQCRAVDERLLSFHAELVAMAKEMAAAQRTSYTMALPTKAGAFHAAQNCPR